ncbi:GNAT family N-acetyltransferase [bacterium]|nr:GNAT family N-acetyltransferase [bacterium]
MQFEVRRLDAAAREDFFRLHSAANEHDWCFCVAWWVESFAGWGERRADQNRALREALFARGESDGYLLYAAGEPVAWCQCAPRDRLAHLAGRYTEDPNPGAFALGCFFTAPAWREKGCARALLSAVIADLRSRGVKRLEAFPRGAGRLPDGEVWTGPAGLYAEFGFQAEAVFGSVTRYALALA